MKKHSIGALMIVEDDHLAGIFTERDAVFRVLAESRDPKKTHVADVMTTPLIENGSFAKSGTSRSASTDPALPPPGSCAATRT